MGGENEATAAEEQAKEFIAENESLLNEAGPSTLQRIITQGADIAVALSEETVQAADELAEVTRELARTVNDPKVPPQRIHTLESRHPALQRAYDRKSAASGRFFSFMERAEALYAERASSERPEQPEQQAPPAQESASESASSRPSFFARLFRRG